MSLSAYAPCEDEVPVIDAASVPVPPDDDGDVDLSSGVQATCAQKCDRVCSVLSMNLHMLPCMHMRTRTYTMFKNRSGHAHVYTMLMSQFQGEPSQVSYLGLENCSLQQ